jgi:hypothetical protein
VQVLRNVPDLNRATYHMPSIFSFKSHVSPSRLPNGGGRMDRLAQSPGLPRLALPEHLPGRSKVVTKGRRPPSIRIEPR